MKIGKLLAAIFVMMCVMALATLAFGQAAKDQGNAVAQPCDAGSAAVKGSDAGTDMGTASGSPLVQPPGGPDLRPREGTSPPPAFGPTPSEESPGAAEAKPKTLPATPPGDAAAPAPEAPSAVSPGQDQSRPSAAPSAAPMPSQPSAGQSMGAEPTGPIVVQPAPDSAVVVPGPSVIVPAPQQQKMPSAAPSDMGSAPGAAPALTSPAQPGGYPPESQIQQEQPRTLPPGIGIHQEPQGSDIRPFRGTEPPPGYVPERQMRAPGTSPITIPSTGVVVPGEPLPGPASPGGMPSGATMREPPSPQAPSAVQPAPSPSAPESGPAGMPPARPEASSVPSGGPSGDPDIIIITPVPQGSSPDTMK